MRILLVSDSYGLVDGVSRSIDAELEFFRERGDTVVVVSTNTEHTRTYHLVAYRGFYHVFDADPRRLARRLRGHRFDVAYGHCMAPQGLFFLLYLSARFGVPMVNRFTTYAPDYMVYTYPPGSGPAAQAMIRWMLTGLLGLTQRRMHRVLLSILCEKMRRYLVEVLRVAPWRVVENRFPERSTPPPRARPRPGVAGADRRCGHPPDNPGPAVRGEERRDARLRLERGAGRSLSAGRMASGRAGAAHGVGAPLRACAATRAPARRGKP